jgi:flavin-dependent dehydrogenase
MRVGIAGGGSAGLLAACRLSQEGFQVELFEEDSEVGYPEHCTGIVRSDFFDTIRYPELSRLVLAKYSGGSLHIGYNTASIGIDTGSVKALMIDRPGYERSLSEIAESNGVRIYKSSKVSIRKRDEKYALLSQGALQSFDLVIGARGARANPFLRLLPGMQARVKLNQGISEEFVNVLASQDTPGFFGWLAPYGGGKFAKVGLAARSRVHRRSIASILSRFGIESEILGYYGGLVVVGGVTRASPDSNYLPLGDEGGQVKPLTGGGLDLAAFAVNSMLHDLVNGDTSLSGYKAWLRKLKQSLMASEIAARVLFGMPISLKWKLAHSLLDSPGVSRVLAASDFDEHSAVLKELAVSRLTAALIG